MNLSLDNLKAFTLGVLKGAFLNKKNLDKVGETTETKKFTYDAEEYATAEQVNELKPKWVILITHKRLCYKKLKM